MNELGVIAELMVNGVLFGAMYGVAAIGLSLIFGTMGIIFLAQGAMIVLGGYAAYWAFRLMGVDPYVMLFLLLPVSLLVGSAMYQLMFRRAAAMQDKNTSLLIAVGLSFMLESVMSLAWTPDPRSITTTYTSSSFQFLGMNWSITRTAGFFVALVAAIGVTQFRIIEDDAKNHNEVKLPLSSVLRQILAERQEAANAPERVAKRRADQEARKASPYVFASWGVKSGHITEAKGTMLAVAEVAGMHIKRHDLRRTFEDAATACRVSDDQRRQLLNHLASDVHGQSYANNPDPKVLAAGVEAVAQWIVNQGAEAEATNVVALPARRA